MVVVQQELREWAQTLKPWQQLAFDKVCCGRPLDDDDYRQLVEAVLYDNQLSESTDANPYSTRQDDAEFTVAHRVVRICKLSNLQNANALVGKQELTFGPALTTIYGDNGSGKSGYARVLGSLAFSRGDCAVLPNIELPVNVQHPITAELVIEYDDGEQSEPLNVDVRSPLSELSSFYVFDSTSVRSHLTDTNTLSFAPAGLDRLTELALIVDEVGRRLKERCAAHLGSYTDGITDWFAGESQVVAALQRLAMTGSLSELKTLSVLSPEEQAKEASLRNRLVELKQTDQTKQLSILLTEIDDLKKLRALLFAGSQKLPAAKIGAVKRMLENYDLMRDKAQHVSAESFSSAKLNQIGGRAWYQFIHAARSYSEEAKTGTPYPSDEDICLLCQQPLEPHAADLIKKLWMFLESDAQENVTKMARMLSTEADLLNAIELDIFDIGSVGRRILEGKNLPLASAITASLESYRVFRGELVAALSAREWKSEPSSVVPFPFGELDAVISQLENEEKNLREIDVTIETQNVEQQLRSFDHRKIVAERYGRLEELVNKRKWARKVNEISCRTNFITLKYDKMFKSLVADRYIEIFNEILTRLKRPLNVSIETVAQKGRAFKRMVVTKASGHVDKDILDKVLSEGEKRAVALADFITEIRLDPKCGGIALDDPVTSLDNSWRREIAQILVNESENRQVIVLTHDLVFLYFLRNKAADDGRDVQSHWIKRGDIDDQPGYVFCNNSPALEQDYRKASFAENIYSRAKVAQPEEQERLIRDGCGALRTCYEAFVIFDLFREVVMRFEERVSIGRLKDITWNQEIALEVEKKTALLSRYIEAHLHSDSTADKPTLKTLRDEIDDYNSMKSRFKNLAKTAVE